MLSAHSIESNLLLFIQWENNQLHGEKMLPIGCLQVMLQFAVIEIVEIKVVVTCITVLGVASGENFQVLIFFIFIFKRIKKYHIYQ